MLSLFRPKKRIKHMAIKRLLKKTLNVNGVKIEKYSYDPNDDSIYIYVSLLKGHKNRCPVCGKKCSGYDQTTVERKWRALDINWHKVYIVCDVHRVLCKDHGVHTEEVPWARHGSGFTKEFEDSVAWMAISLTKKDVSEYMRINWKTVGVILSRVFREKEPDSSVRWANLRRIGIDETSYRKGHKYITVVTDHDRNQVVWAGVGHDSET